MAYRFKHGQTVPQNVKRIASAELGSAIEHLRGKVGVSREDAVHEVRKSLKKARALLRLVKSDLGDFFDDENVQLRDTGKQLSDLRDASALVVTLDDLRKQANGSASGAPMSKVRQVLTEHKRNLEEEAGTQKLLPRLASSLVRARRSIRYWPLKTDGFTAIEAGIEKSFRDGKKALAEARRTGKREDFHEWRKRAKDLWYQIRLLQKMGAGELDGHERALKALEDALGNDLNLAILSERVQALAAGNGTRAKAAAVNKAIESARGELRRRALKIGDAIYSEKPKAFTREIGKLWKAW
jgi:CHAD domain-containing protein